ncbi:HlyD family type I secretion periplasmic adaptor subunit [Ciceribacter sp. RN22]|uniref:HlyD family type I secretion periplasmic adaptor subunit n=1 Tax=Ciceribacter sp. RN22 TaxID=2954932 RepID=UPI0020925A2B|nr:HlyD family type I secretion periplasmic adaptor subunit [Ciceribacter sp. RN22]MCO6181034.1 HlyD family type I secretion periplasmic adaptor subunit [Ciceribacter sp. RN22]
MSSESSDVSGGERWRVLSYDKSKAGRAPMFVGLFMLVPILIAFVAWAVLAPLNAAAIAPGTIVLSSERKTVQHLEGGLVTEIFVSEGEAVVRGQSLLVVQDLAERSRIEALTVQLVNTNAQIARLIAERDAAKAPDFSEIGVGISVSPEIIQRFSDTHLGVFRNLTGSAASAADLAASQKVQIRREIEGLQAQLAAKQREAVLAKQELDGQRILLRDGYSSELKVNTLARAEAVLDGEIGSLMASVAKLEQSVLDQDVELLRLRNERASAMLGELQQAQVAAESARQELRTLRDRQARSVIRAPVDGRVLDMKVHTIGAVITGGTPLMDIVPDRDDLIIEARVSPADIDLVSAGMPAKVQLSAFKAKKVDKIDATVETISGDILTDQMTGERYFLARLRADETAIAALPEDVALSAGMPAIVFMIAGERTMADYLLSPVLDAAYRSFRED